MNIIRVRKPFFFAAGSAEGQKLQVQWGMRIRGCRQSSRNSRTSGVSFFDVYLSLAATLT
jgi:hypothetical protein